ncbi:MAG: hypothetical protein ACRDHP_02985 [Ktedonobacterales bacterium]
MVVPVGNEGAMMRDEQDELKWLANYVRDKKYAEAVLRRLCLGAEILGIEFAGYPDAMNITVGDNLYKRGGNTESDSQYLLYQSQRPGGQARLTIEGHWSVVPALPLPSAEGERSIVESLPSIATDEQLHQLLTLRAERIVTVRLGVQAAHLLLCFESGRSLIVRGDDLYESWQLVLTVMETKKQASEFWLLVDMPGGDIAIWTPDTFNPDFDASAQNSES